LMLAHVKSVGYELPDYSSDWKFEVIQTESEKSNYSASLLSVIT
jgi:hypothetical protein